MDKSKSKLAKANEKIAEGVVHGYKTIEESVVDGYKKIEEGVVGGFTKITDTFVGQFLTKEGESVEDAKERLAQEQADREAKQKETREKAVSRHTIVPGKGQNRDKQNLLSYVYFAIRKG